jgi:hypothetical protein
MEISQKQKNVQSTWDTINICVRFEVFTAVTVKIADVLSFDIMLTGVSKECAAPIFRARE